MSKDVIIYTANFGNYDTFKEPCPVDRRVRYMMYTDSSHFRSNTLDIRRMDFTSISNDPQRGARYVKVNPHLVLPDHKYSIWVDSSFQVRIPNVMRLIENFLGSCDVACFTHGSSTGRHNCLYQEANVCIKENLDDPQIIKKQIEKYKKEKFPMNYGLFSTGFIIRKNNDQAKRFNNCWWSEIKNGSKRDQVSQMYAAWKTGTFIIPMPGCIYTTSMLLKSKHIHKMSKKPKNKIKRGPHGIVKL